MKLVFLGPPGAGKGTQAARVAEQFGLAHASTGDIFRKAVAAGTELGNTVKSYLDGGKLVTDELTSRVVREMVLETTGAYVLDGYPRTVPQAEALDAMLSERGEKLDGVVYFALDDEEAVRRLTGRLVCKTCGANFHKAFMPPKEENVCDACGGELSVRSDSAEDVVRERLAEYAAKTYPLVAWYEERGLLANVDASAAPQDVTTALTAVLEGLAGPRSA